jgi:hypothetical protein
MGFAYDAGAWTNFFFAEVGAAAALVGLLFVAVSINLAKIIALPSLPSRAFEALAVLVMVLLVATFALVPGQSTKVLGVEVLATATAGWAGTLFALRRTPHDPSAPRSWMISRLIATQLATLPMVIAGASLFAGRGGGLYWTLFGVVASFLAALMDAWILLIEIQR